MHSSEQGVYYILLLLLYASDLGPTRGRMRGCQLSSKHYHYLRCISFTRYNNSIKRAIIFLCSVLCAVCVIPMSYVRGFSSYIYLQRSVAAERSRGEPLKILSRQHGPPVPTWSFVGCTRPRSTYLLYVAQTR